MGLVSSISNGFGLAEHDPLEDGDLGVDEQMAWPDNSSTLQTDRYDEFGNVIGYSLTTQTAWDTTVESYDLDGNLTARIHTNNSGYSHSYTREALLEPDGEIAGSTTTYVSSEGSYSDNFVEVHDAAGNLLSSSYRNSHGDWATTTRVAPPEQWIGPAPLSHALQTTGARDDGTTYQRTELFNIHGNLVRMEGAYSDGSTEVYSIMAVSSENGGIEGYVGTWTWVDINGEVSSWSNYLDNQFNPIQMYSHTAVVAEPTYLTIEPELSICTFPVPKIHVDPIPEEYVNPVEIQPVDFDNYGQHPDPESTPTPLRLDHFDEFGNAVGYSLITESEWGTTVDEYDLSENLVSSTYSDNNGYSLIRTWEPVLDPSGIATGTRHTSVSSDGTFSDSRVEIYDSEGNLISYSFSSSDGDKETTTRTAPPKLSIGPAPLSYALKTSGAWAGGTTYERLMVYNIVGQLVRSESIYSDGFTELYSLEPVFSENGNIEGYSGIWTQADQYGEISSFIEPLDSDLKPIPRPVVCWPMSTPSESDGEDGISLDHCFADPKSFPVLYSTVEPQMAYAFRGLSPIDESAETDQPLVAADEEPVAIGEAEPLTTAEEEGVDWTADDTVYRNFISTSTLPDTLATTASIQPLITSEFHDLKLNVHEYQDATHGKLLGELDLALRGNKHNNILIGNTGNNSIIGGRGKDLITGGNGADQFTFLNHRHSFDTITDFNAVEDTFLLKGRDFRNLFKSGELRKEVIGSSLIFDQGTGYLLFSPNGDGANPTPIKLALLTGLQASDFSADLFLFG